MRIKVRSVHTCIRTSASTCRDMLTEQGGEGYIDHALYGFGIVLYLPAAVAGAVVCQMDEIAQWVFCAILGFLAVSRRLTAEECRTRIYRIRGL